MAVKVCRHSQHCTCHFRNCATDKCLLMNLLHHAVQHPGCFVNLFIDGCRQACRVGLYSCTSNSYSSSMVNHLDLQGLEHPVKLHSLHSGSRFCFVCCHCAICALPMPHIAGPPKPCGATLAGHMLVCFEQAVSAASRTHRQDTTPLPNEGMVIGATA